MNGEQEIFPGRIRLDDKKSDITLPSSSTILPSWMMNENRREPYIYIYIY